MKKIIIISMGVITSFAFSSASTHAIDKMVAQIKKPRQGVAMKELSETPDPFVVLRKDVNITEIVKPKKRVNLKLGGIVNHRAHINGVWHKEGDDVSGFVLKYVGSKGVVLMDGEHIKRLFLHEKREGIIKMEEGKQ